MAEQEQHGMIELPEVVVTPYDRGEDSMTAGKGGGSAPGISFSYPAQERQIAARLSGHEWDKIEDFTSQQNEAALAAGYTQDQVDAFQGYPPAFERAEAAKAHVLSASEANPELPRVLESVPEDAEKPVPESAVSTVLTPQARTQYAEALSFGLARGPQDWARSITNEIEKQQPERNEQTAKAAGRLAQAVSEQLPTQTEAVDLATVLASQASSVEPENVAAIKANVLDHWAKTGMTLSQIYLRAQSDQALRDQLTRTQPYPMPQHRPEQHFFGQSQEEFQDYLKNNVFSQELLKGHPDAIHHVALPVNPAGVASTVASEFAASAFSDNSVLKAVENAGFSYSTMYIGGKATGWMLSHGGRLWGYVWKRRPTFDPEKAPSEALGAEEHAEQLQATLKAATKNLKTLSVERSGLPVAPGFDKMSHHVILDEDGKEVGFLSFTKKEPELDENGVAKPADTAHIEMIQLYGQGDWKAGANKLGPKVVRDLARQFFMHHPEINKIEGLRVTGGRAASGQANAMESGVASVSREQVMPNFDKVTGELKGLTPEEVDAGAIYTEMSRAFYGGFWPKDVASGLAHLLGFDPADAAYAGMVKTSFQRMGRYYIAETERSKNAFARAMEPLRKALNQHMDDYKKWLEMGMARPRSPSSLPVAVKMIQYIDGHRSINSLPAASGLRPVANAMQQIITRLQSDAARIGKKNFERFYRGYFAQLWQEPRSEVLAKLGGMPTTKAFPDVSAGLAAGLTPRIADPIEVLLQYSAALSKYINDTKWTKEMVKSGLAKWSKEGEPPFPGWKALNGTIARRISRSKTEQLYAPPGGARIWNNYNGLGVHGWEAGGVNWGNVYDKLMRFTNTLLAARLGWFGFHVSDIAAETQVSYLANALGNISRLELGRGLKDIGYGASLIPGGAHFYRVGEKLQKAWQDLDNSNPVTQLLFHAGMRAEGRSTRYLGGQAFDLQKLASGASFAQLKSRGLLWKELNPKNLLHHPLDYIIHNYERVLDTFNGPLFDKIIPRIKIGAAAEELENWLRHNPRAAARDQQEAAMRIVDRIDDAFGELNQDNLFWKRSVKQILNLLTVSVGWEYGSLRAFGRGAKELFWDGHWQGPYARWLMAFVGHTMMKNAIYQWLHTNTFPWESETPIRDFATPKTGGTFTYKGTTTPERAQLPGYEKEPLTWYRILNEWSDVGQLLRNGTNYPLGKLKFPINQIPLLTFKDTDEGGTNPFHMHDREGNPITSFAYMDLPYGVGSYLNYILKEQLPPITVQQLEHRYLGTNIGTKERLAGVRPAGTFFQQPEQSMQRLQRSNRYIDRRQRRHEVLEEEREER